MQTLGAASAYTTEITNAATQIIEDYGVIIPAALGIAVISIGITLGIRLFKRIASK